jgi:hypothetical protein
MYACVCVCVCMYVKPKLKQAWGNTELVCVCGAVCVCVWPNKIIIKDQAGGTHSRYANCTYVTVKIT